MEEQDVDAPEPEVESPSTGEEQTSQSASSEKEASDAEPESNEEQSPEAGGKTSKLQKLIDSKYGGDEDAFADALYNQWNSSSTLHKELKELKNFISELKQAPEKAPSIEEHPDHQWLKSELTALDEESSAIEASRTELRSDFNATQGELHALEGQLRVVADEAERRDIKNAQRDAEARLKSIKRDWAQLQKDEARITRDRSRLDRQKKQIEGSLQESRAQQKVKEQEDIQEQESFLADFNKAVDLAVEDKGIDTDSKIREHLYQTVRAEAIVYLQSLPNGVGILPADFIQKRAEAYFEVHNIAKKANFSAMSKAKVAVSGKPALSKIAPKPVDRPKFKNGEEAKAWVAKQVALRARG